MHYSIPTIFIQLKIIQFLTCCKLRQLVLVEFDCCKKKKSNINSIHYSSYFFLTSVKHQKHFYWLHNLALSSKLLLFAIEMIHKRRQHNYYNTCNHNNSGQLPRMFINQMSCNANIIHIWAEMQANGQGKVKGPLHYYITISCKCFSVLQNH